MSEEVRLKGEKNNIEKKEENEKEKEKENNHDKKTELSDEAEKTENKEVFQKREEPPYINIRKVSTLSDSVVNYFVISVCLFLHSAYNFGWWELKDEKNFLIGYYIFAGATLYIIGIFNWYEGKELLFLFDFIFSFFFIILFLKEKVGIIGDNTQPNSKIEGLFYILIFAFILIIGISAKEKGVIFIINYAVLFVGFVFLFADKFFEKTKWLKYVRYYAFIVSAAFLWITGILKLVNNCLNNKLNVILGPTD